MRPSRRPVKAASAAPPIPTSPHPAICQGAHGPGPAQKLEITAASAPTAKPGAAPTAYPVKSTTSVVATTLGTGASTTRPATASAARAATIATILEGGRERSYHAKPPTSTTARKAKLATCQLTRVPPPCGASEPP